MSTPARPEGLVLTARRTGARWTPQTGETYGDLVEVITGAWAARAPKRLVREHLGE